MKRRVRGRRIEGGMNVTVGGKTMAGNDADEEEEEYKSMRARERRKSAGSRLIYTRQFQSAEPHLTSICMSLYNLFLNISVVLASTL